MLFFKFKKGLNSQNLSSVSLKPIEKMPIKISYPPPTSGNPTHLFKNIWKTLGNAVSENAVGL